MATLLDTARPVRPPEAPVAAAWPRRPAPINIRLARLVTPRASPTSLEPLAGAGVLLTKLVLTILTLVLAALIGSLIYQEKLFADVSADSLRMTISARDVLPTIAPPSPELLNARHELMKSYIEMANTSREFWSKTAQMILLNLLLPVLTALLGYVFGSKSAEKH